MLDPLYLTTQEEDLGKRLDSFIAQNSHGLSRSKVGALIRSHKVSVDGKPAKASTLLRPGQSICVELESLSELRPETTRPEPIDLDILYEDDDVVAVNKPAGMVVHPAKGHWKGTLTAGLLYRFGTLSQAGGDTRPGIVHRLDRDTTGVILVAKHDAAHHHLTQQFEARTIEKQYTCIVTPAPDRDRDWIHAAIGKHPYQREKMAIEPLGVKCKPASTFFEVVERRGAFGLLHVFPKTGRTHQIRVHLAHVGALILADRQYSGRSQVTERWLKGDRSASGNDEHDVVLNRQALHAQKISFSHPKSDKRIEIEAPLPADLQLAWQTIESS